MTNVLLAAALLLPQPYPVAALSSIQQTVKWFNGPTTVSNRFFIWPIGTTDVKSYVFPATNQMTIVAVPGTMLMEVNAVSSNGMESASSVILNSVSVSTPLTNGLFFFLQSSSDLQNWVTDTNYPTIIVTNGVGVSSRYYRMGYQKWSGSPTNR